ncbi:phosphoglycerate dehydrogenase [Microbacterium protaetiae]|uniref:D-3-phosphoglycerate dehydrogenase n=1 Tax=Microbacterium protaetiae TaxID=2509458 RepID=A0A4P6ESW1_9MICO|nr:phosphoglycerate dehydrogenase [Microbacterium protaetiae]QAY61098.1 phosphoglycerate dehydrogenase [Microbacterium protaetiae]
MTKPVVLLAEQLSPATVDALGPDFEIREVDGTDRSALLSALADADAVLIRSATKMDAEAIAAGSRLKVIARAGVGLDNVDIKAATAAGVMVVNAPTSNIISAAELTIAHILGLARHIPSADASLARGEWKRSAYTGIELFDKTVGIVGLGRIGTLITERLRAFGVRVIGYDPYVTPARAQQLQVELLPLDDVLRQSDFVTVHMPKTPETTGMISTAQLALMKPTAYVVNVARGGLIDEDALFEALTNNVIAGAAIDVFTSEPPAQGGSAQRLLGLPNIVVTPHLGASTGEAQEKAGVSVARSVKLALEGDLVPDAVNVAGGVIDPFVRPGIALVEMLGQFFTGLTEGALTSLDIEVRGELAAYDVSVYRLAALKGIFTNIVSENVSYVNAPLFAEQRGIETRLIVEADSPLYRNITILRGSLSDGTVLSVAGTLAGTRMVPKVVGINDYEIEVPFERYHLVMRYADKPGIVAIYGQLLGDAGINIEGLQVAHPDSSGRALSILTVDSPVPDELVEQIRDAIDADLLRQIEIAEA